MSPLLVGLRAVLLLLLTAVLLPPSLPTPTTITLSRVDRVKSVDFDEDMVWVLVLGSDAKGGTPVLKGNTDAIQLLAIDFTTGASAGIGIPRDSWVDLPGEGFARINTALQRGGTSLAVTAVEQLVRVRVDYVLVTEMNGFIAMTDAIGGIDVVARESFTTDSGAVRVRRGTNHFDGSQALDFARTRRNLVNDFARAANHQALLLGYLRALRAREDEAGFMETVTAAAMSGLQTDMAPTDLYRLAQAITQVDPRKVTGCIVGGGFDTSPAGASIVIPDVVQARRLGRDARRDATLNAGCNG